MIFLVVHDQRPSGGSPIGTTGEVFDVRNPALFVDNEVLDQVQVLRAGLRRQACRRVAVGASIIHVHVEIAAVPPGSRHVHQTFELDPDLSGG
jgi:hypothetical protein